MRGRSSCGISVLISRDTGKNLLSLSQKRAAIYEPESGPFPDTEPIGTLIVDLQSCEKKDLLFISHPVHDILLHQPKTTQTPTNECSTKKKKKAISRKTKMN